MHIEANGAIYDMKFEKHDFESQKSKLLHEIRKAHMKEKANLILNPEMRKADTRALV